MQIFSSSPTPTDSSAADTAAADSSFLDQISDPVDAPARIAEAAGSARDTLLSESFWYGVGWTALKVAFVILVATVAIAVVKRIKRQWVRFVQDNPATDPRRQRVLTTADLLGSVARYVIWAIAALAVLPILGVDIRGLLAGAGIAGLAIGFGAQTLVKDVISGFFLLFDDTLGNGDLIRIGQDVGTVEYVGLRLIKVRKFDGELLMVPAGELRTFGNKSIGFARVIVDVGLSYEQDAAEALRVLEEVAAEWATTDAAKEVMVEDAPQVQGLLALADSAVTARIIVQVKPGEQFATERQIRTLVKERFDERGIEIPFPRRTVYVKPLDGASGDASATAAAAD
ncbi:MAG: mechanosensitive ion channel family protein [Bacteroidota bacterium]